MPEGERRTLKLLYDDLDSDSESAAVSQQETTKTLAEQGEAAEAEGSADAAADSNGTQQAADLDLDRGRNYTPKEIRMELNCTDTTVRNHARGAGLRKRRSRNDPFSTNERLQLIQHIANNASDSHLRNRAGQLLEAESFPKAES